MTTTTVWRVLSIYSSFSLSLSASPPYSVSWRNIFHFRFLVNGIQLNLVEVSSNTILLPLFRTAFVFDICHRRHEQRIERKKREENIVSSVYCIVCVCLCDRNVIASDYKLWIARLLATVIHTLRAWNCFFHCSSSLVRSDALLSFVRLLDDIEITNVFLLPSSPSSPPPPLSTHFTLSFRFQNDSISPHLADATNMLPLARHIVFFLTNCQSAR